MRYSVRAKRLLLVIPLLLFALLVSANGGTPGGEKGNVGENIPEESEEWSNVDSSEEGDTAHDIIINPNLPCKACVLVQYMWDRLEGTELGWHC